MLNPGLARSLFELPLRPLLIETDPAAFNSVQQVLQAFGIRTTIPGFSLISTLPVPAKQIPLINDLPGVLVVHADEQSNILVLPGGDQRESWWPTSESRRMMGSDEASQAGFTGESVQVGVVDTGIDPDHPQLQGSEWDSTILFPREPGIDAGPQASGHGSHVASTAAGRLQSSEVQVFVEGVSRAQIISIQALGRVIGTGFSSEIVNAMVTAFDRGARIINMSLGAKECQGGCDVCPECRVVRELTRRGAIFVIAAGNSGPDANTINCPGCVEEAITVAAVDKDFSTAEFSSRGGSRFPRKPNVAAPGVDIYSGTGRASQVDLGDPLAGVGFAAISGTSMATPHVTGLVALLRQRDPSLTAQRFKEVVAARGLPFSSSLGYGVPTWDMFTQPAANLTAS